MRRLAAVLALIFPLALGVVAASHPVAAQDASPSAGMAPPQFEPIGAGVAEVVPPGPLNLMLFRIRFAPGTGLSEPDGDPGAGVIYVETGELTFSATRPFVVTRAAGMGTPGAAAGAEEQIPANTDVVLHAGDFAFGQSGTGAAIRNVGDGEATVLVSAVRPPEMATPEP